MFVSVSGVLLSSISFNNDFSDSGSFSSSSGSFISSSGSFTSGSFSSGSGSFSSGSGSFSSGSGSFTSTILVVLSTGLFCCILDVLSNKTYGGESSNGGESGA